MMTESAKNQGKRVKKLRKQISLSRAAFCKRQAEHLNVSTLQAIEDGRYKKGISDPMILKIINAFYNEGIAVTSEWLLRGSGTPPKSISAIKLEATRSIKQLSKNEILDKTEYNARIMNLNRSLVKSVMAKELSKAKYLVSQGANAHLLEEKELYIIFGSVQDTLLHVASESSTREMVEYVISELGLHPNIRNRHLDSPAHRACYSNNHETLRTLASFDADLEANSREGATPLFCS